MPRQDTVDFLTAFAVGTVLGIGATLLLQPDRTPKQRVIRQLKPYRKRMEKGYKQVRKGVRHGGEATSEMTSEIIHAGRELLGEFRAEVSDILGEAREELQELVEGRAKDVKRGMKRTRRKLGM